MSTKTKYTYDYPENRHIRSQLRDGDYQDIAMITGYRVGTVKEVLAGRRNNVHIIDTAKHIVAERNMTLGKLTRIFQEEVERGI